MEVMEIYYYQWALLIASLQVVELTSFFLLLSDLVIYLNLVVNHFIAWVLTFSQ